MCQRTPTPPPGWQMEVFEVAPGLSIGTRLAETADYDSLGADVMVDLEDWDWAWVPSVPVGKVFMSFPMEDEDDVDPKVHDVAAFIASLVGSGRNVLVQCTEGLNRSGVVIARLDGDGPVGARGDRARPSRPRTERRWIPGAGQPSLHRVAQLGGQLIGFPVACCSRFLTLPTS